MQNVAIRGLVPVLATPFTETLDLDRGSLRRLVEFQARSGADGVAIFGMASEAFTLTTAEREAILTDVVAAAGPMPVVAGVGATAIAPALEQLRQLADGGARAAMVLPPFMVKPGPLQLVDFYATLAAEAIRLGVSIMVQDAPGATGVAMTPELIVALSDIDGVDSVKVEAPPTLPKMCAVATALGDRPMAMLGGQNAQFVLDEYACGAVGTMPACEFTDLLAATLAAWNSGDRAGARESFARLLPLIVWGLQSGPAWAIHKEVLVRRGIIESAAVRAPAQPIPARMVELLTEVLAPLPLTPASV
ncbi:dihydrodipicolinate synthase family protein [Occultella aeris]|uniref:L-2-keto-3-deoxyarabonate dehydratase n=1 Tax=Occultella aeris TaxID=2761496 RepID=A0A7M4DHK7_9MICO|nr:dihydrodipicolinate synthase family protein [Occultella aeris]VZO36400.1 L-2-keto-3-deoxyarabonate dehydratase [Occultella aeris]